MWWKKYKIIDAHAHIGDFGEFGVSLDVDSLKKLMEEYNYEKCIISNPDNAMVEKAIKDSENILGLVWVNPRKGTKAEDEALKYLKKDGFIGIKLHPLFDAYLPDSIVVHPIAKIAEDFGCPIQFHCGHPPFSLPWSFEELAKSFPEVKIVLVHMGHGHIVYINGAISVAARNPNIFLETSAMPMHTKIKCAVERVGRDRVLYGDDLPFGHPSWELEKVRAACLKNDDLKRVLGENARKLYRL